MKQQSVTSSSRPEVFLGKSVLKISSKFTGENPCRGVISIKLQSKNCEVLKNIYIEEHLQTAVFANTF